MTNGRPIARPTNFNSRPSARGDYPLDASNSPTFLFQFTPLREGRRGNWVRKIKTIDISIHAPPRGATPRICSADYKRGYFNSRPSARGDAGNHQKQAKKANISIHAPPRGATLQSPVKRRQATEFQFTPLREGRQGKQALQGRRGKFQFTPLREGRPLPARRFPIHSIYFNSRPSARGDLTFAEASAQNKKFQFTPLREGRPQSATRWHRRILFQFTPLREGRRAY